MLQAPILGLLISFLVPSIAVQLPLASSHQWQDGSLIKWAIPGDEEVTEWRLDKLPSPNDADHLVFETVHSLLGRWPNSRMKNGHNIVPGVIPTGTLLYHGQPDDGLPTGVEWVATDPDHAHVYCAQIGANRTPIKKETCYLFSLATTRPLKVVYFDGLSAANGPNGTMDTQELLAWGRTLQDNLGVERQMMQDLCKWGEKFGVDGFVRTEWDFEVALCKFTSGLTLVSSAILKSRGEIAGFVPGLITYESIDAGSWHDRFPGETRIQLDLAGLVSFYDTQLVPSLVPIRAGQERWYHRVQNISSENLSTLKLKLEAALLRPSSLSSGIDWKTLIQVIVDRFSGRLELTRHLLNTSATDLSDILDLANKTQTQLRIMLTPYLLFSATPSTDTMNKNDLDWTIPIYKLCATTHTYAMDSLLGSMTDSERLLLRAVRGTSQEICRVVTKMWATGVYAGIDDSLNSKTDPDTVEVTHAWNTWGEDLNRLMTWLDWSAWIKCHPACGPEELCSILWQDLTWSYPPDPGHDGPSSEAPSSSNVRTMAMGNLTETIPRPIVSDKWIRSQPRCIKRVPTPLF